MDPIEQIESAIATIEIEFAWIHAAIAKLRKAKDHCAHEWHADLDNNCNVCIKCGARQEIYTE